MTRKSSLQLVSVLLFLVLCAVGFRIAASKPLWKDELYTQNNAVQGMSSVRLLVGRNTGEGNNAPLFYLIQQWTKFVPDVLVSNELEKDAICADMKKMLLLRIPSVLFMSAALVLLFFFFAMEFSVFAGIYALLCALASPMVWLYWAEARPYPLVVFFTVVQSLILIKMSRGADERDKRWPALVIVNFLLVFTSYLSMIQVLGAALVCWFCGERLGKRLAWILAPVVVALFYRFQGVHEAYDLFFQWSYFLDNIPLDRIAFCAIAALILFVAPPMKAGIVSSKEEQVLGHYSRFLLLVLIGFSLVLLMVKVQETHLKQLGLHSRFFIALTPMGIIEQVLVALCLFRVAIREQWLAWSALAMTILLSVIAFWHTSAQVVSGLKFL
ncbi:MAG: hypothetical protein HQL21_04130 [Candidatus Omnitrophica bacterium]|nr:hypothetical protein [Candidatus Omnitrophota bacterium]